MPFDGIEKRAHPEEAAKRPSRRTHGADRAGLREAARMGIRTGTQLLQSLRDERRLFIDGERVEDVTTDPRFAGAAQSLAELYDMQHDPALIERMTFLSPTSGERVGLSFIEP